ncbi:MAG: PDZ domain-containing protein, partial [Deltaproteobacteria bacterium]|nr:PDZ domain-containing protein [Deltaproteobacteria bacterium]
MKHKTLLAAAGAAVVTTLVGVALWSQGVWSHPTPDLNASLAAGASLDDGPVPVIGASYDLSAHQTLSRVVILIKENYVDPERIRPYEMFMAALDHIEKTVAEVIVDASQAPRQVTVHVGDNEHVFDLERLGGLDQLWEVTLALRDIFRFIQRHITDPAQRREIEYAAINGMLSSLDPHSILLKPESFDEVKLSTKGEFGGLGIVISIRDAALTIISPIEGTPAARAGLKSKDQIVRIGEESTINMGLDEAVNRLRGKPGTKVNIWVLRKGWTEAKRFALTRAVIKIESVASEPLADGIGYLKIKSFQSNTFEDLDAHLERLRQKNGGRLKGLVLDLRNNPGGLLDQAILVSDRFVAEGPLVITVGEGNRKRDVKSAHASGTDADYPIAVLVNGGSASASEIVSGALKNHDRAVVIGQQTFGKGSVQVLYDFKDKSALK